jgi:hypothetical protein
MLGEKISLLFFFYLSIFVLIAFIGTGCGGNENEFKYCTRDPNIN